MGNKRRAAAGKNVAIKRKKKRNGSPAIAPKTRVIKLAPPPKPPQDETPAPQTGQIPLLDDAESGKPFIVGIGASAGGLVAFEQFFKEVPADSNLIYVVVPHLDPNHVSVLPDLIAKYTSMPVIRISDGDKLEPNHVYVVPQNRTLSIKDDHFNLSEFSDDEPRGTRLPINYFFRSLARAAGERAMAVLLSGNGSDGTIGVREIKASGGLVVVQDPVTAQYPGLPQSAIDTGLADSILAPNQMPNRLASYANPLDPSRESPEDVQANLQKILGSLQHHTGHDFSRYKKSTVIRRIERRLNAHHLERLGDYAEYIENHPDEADILFRELLIGVTSFFRDNESFELLKEKIFPAWLTAKAEKDAVRVWVPGCSGGEETYSLAILLAESLAELKLKLKVQVFGTDIDPEAIERARAGLYPQTIEADVSAARLRRFFTKKDDMYEIRKVIREMVIFAPQNVVRDPPFTKLDLISCRNLLIYLDPPLQKKLLQLFHYGLRTDGLLFLGTSESIGGFTDLFSVLDNRWKIYCRKDNRAAPVLFDFQARMAAPAKSFTKIDGNETHFREAIEHAILEKYGPACAIVNEKGDIYYIHGKTGKYLEPSPGRADMNVLSMARDGLRAELPSAIRKAVSQGKDVSYPKVRVRTNGGFHFINLSVRHIQKEPRLQGMLLIAFEPVPEEKTGKKSKKQADSATSSRLRELERDLKYTREHLQTTIEELETSNEELKSTNEELQSTNEELQSANEEMETSKEELQSLNEELITVNGELQAKFDEVAAANNDMMNLLNSTQIATIFVDNYLSVRRFTREASRVINLIQSDIGRPLRHIASNLCDGDLSGDIEHVITSFVPLQKEVQTRDGSWFEMRIIPYRTPENVNVIDGAVLTFNEITHFKTMENRLDDAEREVESNALAETVLNVVRDKLVVMDADLRIIRANQSFCRRFGLDAEDVRGKMLYEIAGGVWDIPRVRRFLQLAVTQENSTVKFHLDHEFGELGVERLLLDARRLVGRDNREKILLLVEDNGNGESRIENEN